MFHPVMDDFALQILIGERVASMIWRSNVLYLIVIIGYVSWRYWRYRHGEPLCHHRHCNHLSKQAKKEELKHARH